MQKEYFELLNQALKAKDKCMPRMLIDLNILDENIQALKQIIHTDNDIRLVVKSLPSIELIRYLMEKLTTKKLMVFHLPFLIQCFKKFSNSEILLGKPMPAKNALYFYNNISSSLKDLSPGIQWLIDTTERLEDYLKIADELKVSLQINLEIDVGLHRGGFSDLLELSKALKTLELNSDKIKFSGFMGYDPHVVKLPRIVSSASKAFNKSNDFYQNCKDLLKKEFPSLFHNNLTFNGAGSPSLQMHKSGSAINDVAVGSALLKPTSFDISSLNKFKPALFIASPILKKLKGIEIPGIEFARNLFRLISPRNKHSYFIYGGYWKAIYCYPTDARENSIFGSSTNQSLVNSSLDLNIEDYIFLRPTQSEFVLLQFGNILTYRNGRIEGEWTVLDNN